MTFGVREVVVDLGRTSILRSVSFDVMRGCTVLMGPNGSGKTSICRAILGDIPIHSGDVVVDAVPVRSAAHWREFRGQLGWLPQSFGAPSRASLDSILRYAAWLKSCDVDVGQSLAAVGLSGLAGRRFGHLSGGQMRRVGIACATLGSPRGVLLDEPTVGLDPEQRDDFHRLVRDLAANTSVLISTHLLEDVAAMATHVVVLHRGIVQFRGSPEELAGEASPGVDALRAGYLRAVS